MEMIYSAILDRVFTFSKNGMPIIVYMTYIYDGNRPYPVGYFGGESPERAIYQAMLSFPKIDYPKVLAEFKQRG